MNAVAVFNPVLHQFRGLAVAAIAHALIVLLLWLGVFYADLDFIPGHMWLLMFWAWLIWPLLLILHPARTFKRVAVAVAICVALLVPCLSTAFALTAWALGGFAP